jgi:hypothetical protein
VYNKRFHLQDPNAILFVLTSENGKDTGYEELIRRGEKIPEPLVLRASAGECITVSLQNKLPKPMADGLSFPGTWSYNLMPPLLEGFNFNSVTASSRVALHPQLLAHNASFESGGQVGLNPDTTSEDEAGTIHNWYAGDLSYKGNPAKPDWKAIEFGVVALQDQADVIKHASHGAVGALVVEPEGSTWETDCQILKKADCLDAAATVTQKDGKKFRELVVIYQDDLSLRRNGEPLPNLRNGDDAEDSGQKAFNYKTEPLWARLGADPAADPETMNEYDYTNVFRSAPADPATPLFTAEAGMPVRFRVVEPAGHPRNHGFTVFGHDWILNPWAKDSTVLDAHNPESANRFGSASGIGPARHVNLLIDHAGGSMGVPGDYMYRTQEGFMFSGGLWGIFRVLPKCAGRTVHDKTGQLRVCK